MSCAAGTYARIRLGFGRDWRFPGYEPSLKVAREHVPLYPADGFSFLVSSGAAFGMPGDVLHWRGAARLQISTPPGTKLPLIQVYRDGREITEEQARTIDEPIAGPGRHQAEVFLRQPGLTGWRRWKLWVFTNPAYVAAQ